MKFHELSPCIDRLDDDAATIFFGQYHERREADLCEDCAPVAKKKAAIKARSKATKKGKQIKVTPDELRALRALGLIS